MDEESREKLRGREAAGTERAGRRRGLGGCSADDREAYLTTIGTAPTLFTRLAPRRPPGTVTCTFPLKGRDRVIVTVCAVLS
jgi:hypothetical protein